MRRLRWLILEIGIATLLLVAVHGTLWAFTEAAAPVQIEPPARDRLQVPLPPARWVTQPVVTPTVSRPTAEATPAPAITPIPSSSASVTAKSEITVTGVPTYYVVLPGDTLFIIATDFGTTVEALMAANGLSNSDMLFAGQLLLIPGADGELPDPALLPVVTLDAALTPTVIVPRGTITERMTSLAQQANVASPYHNTTWLTYYGRPNVPVMGILGEYPIEELAPLLRVEADAYDQANGESLTVPLLLPDEVLGNRPYRGSDFFMDVTPNLIIYQ